ncbi:unnamed protein product [Adineta steineri]|nr:unnamed protein product [Adineta steineri]
MNITASCYGLFIDINDTLYCSMANRHQVVKRSLNDPQTTSNRVAAGTGIKGSASNQLTYPGGIFVDENLDLYVTDCGNDRVQLFQSGESNGITVAGSTSLNPTITLYCPTGIILDAEKYLFIVDNGNHRIVGSALNGFRCLVGCYGAGSQSNQLNYPFSFSFDSYGNMFVTHSLNHRIQKFQYLEESCGLTTTTAMTTAKTTITPMKTTVTITTTTETMKTIVTTTTGRTTVSATAMTATTLSTTVTTMTTTTISTTTTTTTTVTTTTTSSSGAVTTTTTTVTTTSATTTTINSSAVTTWLSSKFGQFALVAPTALIYLIYIHN